MRACACRECDFDVAYSLTSPVGRAVAGTRDRFRAALQVNYLVLLQQLVLQLRKRGGRLRHARAGRWRNRKQHPNHLGQCSCLVLTAALLQAHVMWGADAASA